MMRRRWLIFVAGLFLAVCGYCALYFAGTANHRQLMEQATPELAWLKHEFNLGNAEFERITKLHEEYLPNCEKMCRLIMVKNKELGELMAHTNAVTPEIEKNLLEAGQLRAECQRRMLAHFYEVSRTMPPEQGQRYLEWVRERTILRSRGRDAMADMHQ